MLIQRTLEQIQHHSPFGLLAKSCANNNKKVYKLNILISMYEHVQITNVLDTIVL